jgi:4-hydroxybenzoyl-CoA thioesterase
MQWIVRSESPRCSTNCPSSDETNLLPKLQSAIHFWAPKPFIIVKLQAGNLTSRIERNPVKKRVLSNKKKIISRKTIRIEWGDCDPAQIVYFPRYFAYFDACTSALFLKAGLPKRKMLKDYRIIGIPLVDVRASFMVPSRVSDVVVVESEITEWRRSSFCIQHKLFNKKVLAVECSEIRVWAGVSATDAEKIEGKPVPPEVIAKFSPAESRHRNRPAPRLERK